MPGREWADAEYSRIYHTVVDDEKFADVFYDDHAWAAYTRLLMAAESAYPTPAPLPRWLADDVLEQLVEARIIEVVRGSAYRIVGLKAEREGRLNGNAIGGKARAEKAQRDDHGRFQPAPGPGPSDDTSDAPASPAKSSVSTSDNPARSTSDGPAGQRSRDETRQDEDSLPEGDSRAKTNGKVERADIQALLDRGWPKVTRAQRKVLDEVLSRHDLTGPEFAANAIRQTAPADDPFAAVMAADRLWQAGQRKKADADDAAWQAIKDREAADATEKAEADDDIGSWLRIETAP